MIAEERVRPLVVDKFPPGRAGGAIMQKNHARVACPQQIEGELQRTKIFWPVDENSITMFETPRQNIAGIAKQRFHVAMRSEPGQSNRVVRGANIQFHAHDSHIGKTMCHRQRASALCAAGFQDLSRVQRSNHAVKQEHFAKENAATALLFRDGFDAGLEFGQKTICAGKNRVDANRRT